MMLVGAYLGFVIGIGFIAGRVWGWIVLMFYLAVIYSDENNAYIAKCLLVVWLVSMVVKCVFKKKDDTFYHTMMNVYHKPTDWMAIGNGIGFYVEIGIIIGLTYLVYSLRVTIWLWTCFPWCLGNNKHNDIVT